MAGRGRIQAQASAGRETTAPEGPRWLGLFRAIVDSSPEAVYVAELQGRVIYLNPAHERMFGRPLAEGRRDEFRLYYASDGVALMEGQVLPAILDGRPWEGEIKGRAAAGRHLPLWQRCAPLQGGEGAPPRFFAIIQDLSSRQRTEQALRDSQARYLAILEDQAELICRSAADGVLTFVNEAYCRYFGRSREELIGHAFLPPFPGEDGQALVRHLASLSRENPLGAVEHRVIAPDGRLRWLRWTTRVIFDAQGHFDEYQSVGIDITEQKEAEERLRESQARYLAILEDQTELICRSAADGALTFVNEAYCRYFGRSREELIGHAFLPPLPGQDGRVLAEHLASLSHERPVGDLEHRVIAPDGQVRWLRWTTRAIFDAQGAFSEFQSVGRDVTERRQAQEALEEAHATLEERVKERTAELEAANTKLALVVAELQQARDELHRLSFLDGLTGVANRRYFDEQVEQEWRRMTRQARPLAVIMIDIDKFKAFNDTYGHQAGDECLQRVAQALAGSLKRPGDFLARYGGEEFVAVLPDTDLTGALQLAEQMRHNVAQLGIAHEHSPSGGVVTVSLGVAAPVAAPGSGPQDAVAMADAALYEAKQAGRNRVHGPLQRL